MNSCLIKFALSCSKMDSSSNSRSQLLSLERIFSCSISVWDIPPEYSRYLMQRRLSQFVINISTPCIVRSLDFCMNNFSSFWNRFSRKTAKMLVEIVNQLIFNKRGHFLHFNILFRLFWYENDENVNSFDQPN